MCGIFGFALIKPVPMNRVFKVLARLEVHQYPQEPRPVGGYGAGVAILDHDEIRFEKVGKVDASPAKRLSSIMTIDNANVLVGHVRMPSLRFMEKAQFWETAQPYVAKCHSDLTVVSVHNGYVTNYKRLRRKLGKEHVFDSDKIELVDSEVIPHCFEELFKKKKDATKALDALYSDLGGSNAIAMLQVAKEEKSLHLIHKGKTRGLFVWQNRQDEILFCSRKEPIIQEFSSILIEHEFEEKIAIPYHKDANLKMSFPLNKIT